jgi:hypothetical protein
LKSFILILDHFFHVLAQRDVGRVVAFGMGSRCPEPESVSEMGESLLDCHALALARRAFIQ